MTLNTGPTVVGTIQPKDSQDSYATHDEQYGLGGCRSGSSSDRDAIPAQRRKAGMLFTLTDRNPYVTQQLGSDLTTWSTFAAGGGGGGNGTTTQVTPSDTATLTNCNDFYVVEGGTVSFVDSNSVTRTLTLAPQERANFGPKKILATGTDTGITIIGFFP